MPRWMGRRLFAATIIAVAVATVVLELLEVGLQLIAELLGPFTRVARAASLFHTARAIGVRRDCACGGVAGKAARRLAVVAARLLRFRGLRHHLLHHLLLGGTFAAL